MQRTEFFGHHLIFDEVVGGFVDQDAGGNFFCEGLDALGVVDVFSDGGVFEPARGADVSYDDLAGRNADPDADLRFTGAGPLRVQAAERVLHGQGDLHGP